MQKTLIALALAVSAFGAQAKLIQHTDQIAEIKFTGSNYELGKHVGEVAGDQVLTAMGRFDKLMGIMLEGLSLDKITQTFEENGVHAKLMETSPHAGQYIKGLAESLNMSPNRLLAVGMADEAVLESQRKGGMGFLESEAPHDPSAPSKCTIFAYADGSGTAWGHYNYDYMAINYEQLIVMNHTDVDGKTKVVQTWAGLLPYGGVTKGGQAIIGNTLADEGTARQLDGGEIIEKDSTPSFHLAWEIYEGQKPQDLVNIYAMYDKYTAYYSYTAIGANSELVSVENTYADGLHITGGKALTHANHSTTKHHKFVDKAFGSKSLVRQKAADEFMKKASTNTTKEEAFAFAKSEPLWKGRGDMMGTVTTTHFRVNGKKVDLYMRTDDEHKEVRISNYQRPVEQS